MTTVTFVLLAFIAGTAFGVLLAAYASLDGTRR